MVMTPVNDRRWQCMWSMESEVSSRQLVLLKKLCDPSFYVEYIDEGRIRSLMKGNQMMIKKRVWSFERAVIVENEHYDIFNLLFIKYYSCLKKYINSYQNEQSIHNDSISVRHYKHIQHSPVRPHSIFKNYHPAKLSPRRNYYKLKYVRFLYL